MLSAPCSRYAPARKSRSASVGQGRGLRSVSPGALRMRLLNILLVAVLVLSLAPVRAHAANDITVTPNSQILNQIVESYGYTDEGITLGLMAQRIGCTTAQAAVLAATADYWVTSGVPGARGTVGASAAMAEAYAVYLREKGQWSTFADRVDSIRKWGTNYTLAGGGLFDMLGFASIADERSYETYAADGRTYSSGFATWLNLPSTTLRKEYSNTNAQWAAFTPTQQRNSLGMMYDAGFWIKASDVQVLGGTSSGLPKETIRSYKGWWSCSLCNVRGALGSSDWSNLAEWRASEEAFIYTGFLAPSWMNHNCGEPISEAAQSVRAAVDGGLLPSALRFGLGIFDPVTTLASVLDTYGIPGFLPPGAVNDGADDMEDFGAGLRDKAGELLDVAASLPVGFKELVEGVAAGLLWLGNLFKNLGDWVYAVFLPNPDYVSIEVKNVLDSAQADLRVRQPAATFYMVGDALDSVSKSGASGAGAALLRPTLSLPRGKTLVIDLREVLAKIAPFRGYLVGFVYFGLLMFFLRYIRVRPSEVLGK